MGIQTTLNEVLPTSDGPWECFDTVLPARDIERLYTQGFLKIDYDIQRGRDTMTGKPVIDPKKIERWTEELIKGEAIMGQCTWNFRREETKIEYDPEGRKLVVHYGEAHVPDSAHRHRAIVEAVRSVQRGSLFDLNRQVSLRIYNVTKEDEARIFYSYNQEGKHADATRSKWLYPKENAQRLARELVRRSPHLQNNVDTIRDRMSQKNPRLCAFNTIAKAFEDHWSDVDPSGSNFDENLEWLTRFWDALALVLPELGVLDINKRREVRETSLVDSALAIQGYVALARRMKDANAPFDMLKKLAAMFFDRNKPKWQQLGILVPAVNKDGTTVLTLRNAMQTRRAMVEALSDQLGVSPVNAIAAA